MKYAVKNFIRVFQNDRLIGGLAILCIVASVMIMHFGYGLYQNFNALLVGEESGMHTLTIKVNEPDAVTKEKVVACFTSLSLETQDNIHTITAFSTLEAAPKKPFAGESGNANVQCFFSVSGGKVTKSLKFQKVHEQQGDLFGNYFTDEDFQSNKKVALFDRKMFEIRSPQDTEEKRQERVEMYQYPDADAPMGYDIMIDGELYQVIGSLDGWFTLVPITQLKDGTTFTNLFLRFGNDTEDGFITREQYNDIHDALLSYFGNAVTVPDIPLPDLDLQKLYRTVILIAGLIALIAGFNFTQLYLYILEKRRKRIAVMRICGCSKNRAASIFLIECMLFMFPAYLVSYLTFRYAVLPQCSKAFPFMADSFSPKIYLVLFCIFAGVSLLEINMMILHFLAGKDLVGKERGR